MNEDNNGNNNTPSTDPDVMPTGGSSIGQAVKNRVRKFTDSVKEGAVRGIKAVWAFLLMTVKKVVIVVIIILIVICALLLMGMIEEGTSVAKSNVDDYISGATDLDEDAKSLYDEKASLIKLKLSDVNSIYDNFIKDEKGGSETQTLMQYKIGEKDVSDDNRIVDINDKLPVYKHILLTEKYNFNSINWQKFSHNATAGEKVKDYKEDKELGLKYPDTTKNNAGDPKEMKVEKFIDLTLPYLQTWYIPLAMSNASIINGTEEDNNRAPAFSYNIIKEAYSNIIVNWYELKKHTTVTKYLTYDEVKKHDVLYGVEVVERIYENGDKSYSLRTSGVSPATFEDGRLPKNTSTSNGLIDGKKDPMKEELVSQKDEYTSNYYVKEADVFDAKIINEFNYQVYSDADANKRINADSTSETTATWAKAADNVQNMSRFAINEISVDSNGNLSVSGANYSVTNEGSYTEDDPSHTAETINVYRKNIVLGQYTDYENGLEHTVTRIWKDKLSQTDSQTSDYTIDDLILYNQSDDRKEKVTGMDLCGTSSSSSTSISSSGNSNMADIAKNLVNEIGNHKVEYASPRDNGDGFATSIYVCTSFVEEVIHKATNHAVKITAGRVNELGEELLKNNKFELVYYKALQISYPDISGNVNADRAPKDVMKPGDIVATYSNGATFQHVMIYLGDGKYANMADIASAVCISTRDDNTIPVKYVFRLKGDGTSSSSSSSSTSNSSSTPKGNGQGKVTSTSNVNSTGYTGIFTSGTTGRTFKEYKQNGNTFVGKYDISSVGCSWSSECGTVSTMIVGSGYSDKATFADATNKLKSTGRRNTVYSMVK